MAGVISGSYTQRGESTSALEEKRRLEAERRARESDMIFNQGGYRINDDLENLVSGYNYGSNMGRKEFFEDPRMVEIENMKRARLGGYDSAIGGAIRATARGETAGQQSQYLSQLRSRAAQQGVGGARGLAMEAGAKDKFAKTTAEQERKMALDSYQEGLKAEQDFAKFRQAQKYGQMSTGAGFGQAMSAQNAAQKQANAANSGGGNSYICTEIHKHDKFTLGQLKELMKMRKYVGSVNQNMIDIYDVEGPKLVAALNDKKITWVNLKPIVEEIIKEWKSDKHLGAFLYVQFIKDLGVLANG